MYKAIYNKDNEYLILIRLDNNNLYVKDNRVTFYYNANNYNAKSFIEAISRKLINKNRLFLLYGDVFKTVVLNDSQAISMEITSISKRMNYIMSLFKKDLKFLNDKKSVVRSVKKYGIKPTKHIRRKLP